MNHCEGRNFNRFQFCHNWDYLTEDERKQCLKFFGLLFGLFCKGKPYARNSRAKSLPVCVLYNFLAARATTNGLTYYTMHEYSTLFPL